MTQHPIPPATLTAGAQADPDWWQVAATWHEERATLFAHVLAVHESAYHHAAALACRTFAEMMRREQEDGILPCWKILRDGSATWEYDGPEGGRSLPAAAVAALTEGEA